MFMFSGNLTFGDEVSKAGFLGYGAEVMFFPQKEENNLD